MTNAEKTLEDRVVVEDPEHMNILGLLMKGLLAENLEDEKLYAKACRMSGDVLVQAGDMSVTLRFGDSGLTIIRETDVKPGARVAGTMTALLGVVTGQGMVGPFLSGKIKIGGNPFRLLSALPFIRSRN